MKPVRINIQNKELWEKEQRLHKKWENIAKLSMVITIIWLAGLVLIPLFDGPKWLGYTWIVFAIIVAFSGLLTIIKIKIHSYNAYIYKFGTKKQIRSITKQDN